MRTTLNLDPVILAAAKEVAAETHRSAGDVISARAARGLQAGARNQTRVEKGNTEKPMFPVFDVPADSPPITSQRVKHLLGETGL
jgi:hypothetical protein